MTSSHVKKLEVTEMKTEDCRCGHPLRDHVRNDDIWERPKVENITERTKDEVHDRNGWRRIVCAAATPQLLRGRG